MRIAVGQLWQETNTFNPNPTTWADFEAMGVATGADILERFSETGELSGFLGEFQQQRPEAEYVGLARFACWPWGAVDDATWERIRKTFVDQLAACGPVDGVYLTLHGAICSESEPDLTGAILELVREAVGPDVPIAGSLDLHANITSRMMNNADVLAGYHACPHIDGVETGARAARGLDWCLKTGRRPVNYVRKLPMITAAETNDTFNGPPAPLYRTIETLEQEDGVLTAGLYMSMPWFDRPNLGWTYTLTVEEADPRWRSTIDELAASAWALREDMDSIERFEPADVVHRAIAVEGKPVVIGDGADSTNSGCPGDETPLLKEFLNQEAIPDGALTFLVDPEAVAAANSAGEGGVFDAFVGGKLSSFSEPVRVVGTVEKLFEVKWILDGHICNNLPIDMGRGAVIQAGDVTILLCERSGPGSSPKLYESAGLDPREFGIVVAKSPAGFRADYGPFAAEILLADCAGCASPHWSRLPFDQVTRPLWPLDPDCGPEAEWCFAIGDRQE